MKCEGCGTTEATVTRTVVVGGEIFEGCDICSGIRAPCVCDVFFRRPYFDENLASDSHPMGRMVESRSHKAHIMKELGLREDGDRQHGSIFKGVSKGRKPINKQFSEKLKSAISKHVRSRRFSGKK